MTEIFRPKAISPVDAEDLDLDDLLNRESRVSFCSLRTRIHTAGRPLRERPHRGPTAATTLLPIAPYHRAARCWPYRR